MNNPIIFKGFYLSPDPNDDNFYCLNCKTKLTPEQVQPENFKNHECPEL
jgi:hypothetical protein